MDPDACVARIADALAAGSLPDAVETAGDLRGWVARGGFPPRVENVQRLRRMAVSMSPAPAAITELLEVLGGA